MGEYGVSCCASNITIFNQDVKFFICRPKIWKGDNPKYMGIMLDDLNHRPDSMMYPFCLPLTASYNGYGSIECIVRDSTVKLLEEYFEMDITNIIEIITDRGPGLENYNISEEKKDILSSLTFCFMLKDVYDSYVRIYEERTKSEENMWGDPIVIEILEDFGFVCKIESEYPEYPELVNNPIFHKQVCINPKFDGLSIELRKTYDSPDVKINGNKLKINSFGDLVIKINEEYGVNIREEYNVDEDKVYVAQSLFNLRFRFSEGKPLSEYPKENFYTLSNNKLKLLENYRETRDYISVFYLMYSCNLFFIDRQSGEQYGNHKLQREVALKHVDILTKLIKEEEDE